MRAAGIQTMVTLLLDSVSRSICGWRDRVVFACICMILLNFFSSMPGPKFQNNPKHISTEGGNLQTHPRPRPSQQRPSATGIQQNIQRSAPQDQQSSNESADFHLLVEKCQRASHRTRHTSIDFLVTPGTLRRPSPRLCWSVLGRGEEGSGLPPFLRRPPALRITHRGT